MTFTRYMLASAKARDDHQACQTIMGGGATNHPPYHQIHRLASGEYMLRVAADYAGPVTEAIRLHANGTQWLPASGSSIIVASGLVALDTAPSASGCPIIVDLTTATEPPPLSINTSRQLVVTDNVGNVVITAAALAPTGITARAQALEFYLIVDRVNYAQRVSLYTATFDGTLTKEAEVDHPLATGEIFTNHVYAFGHIGTAATFGCQPLLDYLSAAESTDGDDAPSITPYPRYRLTGGDEDAPPVVMGSYAEWTGAIAEVDDPVITNSGGTVTYTATTCVDTSNPFLAYMVGMAIATEPGCWNQIASVVAGTATMIGAWPAAFGGTPAAGDRYWIYGSNMDTDFWETLVAGERQVARYSADLITGATPKIPTDAVMDWLQIRYTHRNLAFKTNIDTLLIVSGGEYTQRPNVASTSYVGTGSQFFTNPSGGAAWNRLNAGLKADGYSFVEFGVYAPSDGSVGGRASKISCEWVWHNSYIEAEDAPPETITQGIAVGKGPVLRPQYDHLADMRTGPVGEFLRGVREIERMSERAVRI